MKYYSEKLAKFFETEEELKSAEKADDEEGAKAVGEAYQRYLKQLRK